LVELTKSPKEQIAARDLEAAGHFSVISYSELMDLGLRLHRGIACRDLLRRVLKPSFNNLDVFGLELVGRANGVGQASLSVGLEKV
jgi:hypothetical protein